MPPKGYKSVTLPEGLLIDLNLLKLELKAKSFTEVISKLIKHYRTGRRF